MILIFKIISNNYLQNQISYLTLFGLKEKPKQLEIKIIKDKLKIKVVVGYLQEIKFKFPINLV